MTPLPPFSPSPALPPATLPPCHPATLPPAAGDHIALMNVFNGWAETNFAAQWCFENFVQVGWAGLGWAGTPWRPAAVARCGWLLPDIAAA